jgi:hypothetical protein
MGINIEMVWDEPMTIGQLEEFLAQARAAGAQSDTKVDEITHDQDPQIVLGWRVAAADTSRQPRDVPMPHRLMWNIHSMLEQIGNGDGDVRGLQAEVMDLDSALLEALMKHVG